MVASRLGVALFGAPARPSSNIHLLTCGAGVLECEYRVQLGSTLDALAALPAFLDPLDKGSLSEESGNSLQFSEVQIQVLFSRRNFLATQTHRHRVQRESTDSFAETRFNF
jgi:hypothetical protein